MLSRRKSILCLLSVAAVSLLLTLRAAPARGEDLDASLEGPNVLIRYPQGIRSWADLTLKFSTDADRLALDTLGITAGRRVNLHLYNTTAGFQKATDYALPDTLGVAIPSASLIVIDCSKAALRGQNSLGITIRHEMIHIAFGRLEGRSGQGVPLWFNEGVATWSSGRLAEEDPKVLVSAVNADSLMSLRSISESFPTSRIARELAYQEGESTIRFLVHDFGPDAVKRLVRLMSDGADFNTALAKVTGGIDFEAKWKEYLRRRYPFYAFLEDFFFAFGGAGLLLVVAYAVYRIHRYRVMRQWREEERAEFGDEPDYEQPPDEENEEWGMRNDE